MDTDTLRRLRFETNCLFFVKFCSLMESSPVFGIVCMELMVVHDYHLGNTAGFWARWSTECVHTALRGNHLVQCTAVQTLQDR